MKERRDESVSGAAPWGLLGIRDRRNESNTATLGIDLVVVRPSGSAVGVRLSNADLLKLIREAAAHLKPAP